MRDRRGFTLIELLVVVSILAMLIAMLLPSLKKAQDAARAVVCLSNERQVMFCFDQYAEDYGQAFPLRRIAPPTNTWWSMFLEARYEPSAPSKVFDCPAARIRYPEDSLKYGVNRIYTLGYGYNWRCLGDPGNPIQRFFNKLKAPSSQLVIADSTEDLYDQDLVDWLSPAGAGNAVNPRHPSKTVNVGFADMHAGPLMYSQLIPAKAAGSSLRYWKEY